ncbi:MAG TPA: hypothetical protein VK166_12715, partial [Chitinophagaceae bacterium]|nr:hypothetical protein [Chitinophagaceae bacterium]
FRIPLINNKKISFFKLLGCGRGGNFDLRPDWNQYGIFTVSETEQIFPFSPDRYEQWKKDYYGGFISRWWRFCGSETWTIILDPLMSHGSWSGVELFPDAKNRPGAAPIAVLTRASIRPSKAMDFWKNVKPVQEQMKHAPGLAFSVGIGEMPFLKQATFSLWENEEYMKSFAYSMQQHRDVIAKTRSRNWYSEEMFTRFRPIAQAGSLKGMDPLHSLGLSHSHIL